METDAIMFRQTVTLVKVCFIVVKVCCIQLEEHRSSLDCSVDDGGYAYYGYWHK
jgi:hypothetical protein